MLFHLNASIRDQIRRNTSQQIVHHCLYDHREILLVWAQQRHVAASIIQMSHSIAVHQVVPTNIGELGRMSCKITEQTYLHRSCAEYT